MTQESVERVKAQVLELLAERKLKIEVKALAKEQIVEDAAQDVASILAMFENLCLKKLQASQEELSTQLEADYLLLLD